MHDARAVANTILTACKRQGLSVTNLKLQKLLYFVHGRILLEQGHALLSGEFEAWQYGPVHPLVYSAFKDFGAGEIVEPATKFHPITRMRTPIGEIDDPTVVRHIAAVVSSMGAMSPGQLVDLTHVKGGPWARTVEEASGSANIGLKISNETIKQYFAKPKVVTRDGLEQHNFGEVRENAPYS